MLMVVVVVFFCCSVGTLLQRFFLFTYLCNFSQIIYNVCAFHFFPFLRCIREPRNLKRDFSQTWRSCFFLFQKKKSVNLSQQVRISVEIMNDLAKNRSNVMCLFCFFWETGLFVLYFCLMNNCSDGSDEVSFFFLFFRQVFQT